MPALPYLNKSYQFLTLCAYFSSMNPNTKKELLSVCLDLINEKLDIVESELLAVKTAIRNETKSSAGDKYETGRAMLMQEQDKLSSQKEQLYKHLVPLQKIDDKVVIESAQLGAIVVTTMGNYFIASSLGNLEVFDDDYFVVSTVSPIAQEIIGKKRGDSFEFNGSTHQILRVS